MRYTKLFALSVAITALLVGCSTPPAQPSSTSSSTPAPAVTESAPAPSPSESFTAGAPDGQCLTANLAASIAEADSSAGHLHFVVTFTNKGEACVLEGFPTIQVTAAGTPLGVAAQEDSTAKPTAVSLATGGTALAALTVINIASGGGPLGDACTVGEGNAFAVTPPHSTVALPVAMLNVPACSNGMQWMTVSPISPS